MLKQKFDNDAELDRLKNILSSAELRRWEILLSCAWVLGKLSLIHPIELLFLRILIIMLENK